MWELSDSAVCHANPGHFGFLFIYLFLAVLGLHCCTGSSLLAPSRVYALAAVHGLLISVASLAAEHEL